MSYNILARGLDGTAQFPYASEDILDFDYRKKLVVQEIKESQADIICFQEFCDEVYFEEQLSELGYELKA